MGKKIGGGGTSASEQRMGGGVALKGKIHKMLNDMNKMLKI